MQYTIVHVCYFFYVDFTKKEVFVPVCHGIIESQWKTCFSFSTQWLHTTMIIIQNWRQNVIIPTWNKEDKRKKSIKVFENVWMLYYFFQMFKEIDWFVESWKTLFRQNSE